jgi:hypothetical protein
MDLEKNEQSVSNTLREEVDADRDDGSMKSQSKNYAARVSESSELPQASLKEEEDAIQPALSTVPDIPNGGLHAWLVVLAVSLFLWGSGGIAKTLTFVFFNL